VRDLKERGEFTDVHRRLIEDITQRHDQIRKKVALAENRGTPWDVIKSQTERDFSSIFDDLLQIGEKLDSDEMKRRYPNVTQPQEICDNSMTWKFLQKFLQNKAEQQVPRCLI
jgi:hypothetical protein